MSYSEWVKGRETGYIDRAKLLNEMEHECENCEFRDSDGYECEECDYAHAMLYVKAQKAIKLQPVEHGKWESSQRTIETGTVYCSNCAIEYYISDLQTVGDCNGIVHYCPNCGARMDDTEPIKG